MDVHDRLNPKFVSCYGNDGYVHDTECIIYHGPDTLFTGHEICFGYNEDSLTIMDVTDKHNIKCLSRVVYSGMVYSHQVGPAWFPGSGVI